MAMAGKPKQKIKKPRITLIKNPDYDISSTGGCARGARGARATRLQRCLPTEAALQALQAGGQVRGKIPGQQGRLVGKTRSYRIIVQETVKYPQRSIAAYQPKRFMVFAAPRKVVF